MYFELIYNSIAIENITSNDIVQILEEANKFNKENDITGCLLFHKGEFLQILEGEKKVVQELYSRIERDKRHHHVMLVFTDNATEQRIFDTWSMAFKELTDVNMTDLKDYLNLKEFDRLLRFIDEPTAAKSMFRYFANAILGKKEKNNN